MAEAGSGQAPPTFKLVLVGDGGTGKVSAKYWFKDRFLCEQEWAHGAITSCPEVCGLIYRGQMCSI